MRAMSRTRVVLAVAVVGLALLAPPAGATHSWGGYHWARTNPFTLKLGDNLNTVDWDSRLSQASTDWSVSAALDTKIETGGAGAPKRCRATLGRVEVCNSTYGFNGWLGIAQIWASGVHITQGTVKVNDSYFNTATYNTPEWRQFVMCQEVGHTLGLDHQDEIFDNANLGTCMDYTNYPAGGVNTSAGLKSNLHPDAHDYYQLDTVIYAHNDTGTTVASSTSSTGAAGADAGGNSAAEWGQALRNDGNGRPSLFAQDLGRGARVFTFVIWAR